ncbi:ankyrin repeat domain-containing protein [Roseateles chitinivorans]|uniref:ankyrin repeat domain-containing protein n=1 Tax=Roseateles chitinivorans TaxID=2917965 RepID=UPI003D663DB3
MPDAAPSTSSTPLHERYLARLKQRRGVAVLLVIAAIVTGVAGFTDSAKKLVALFQPEHVEDPRQQLVKLGQPFTQDGFVAAATRGDEAAVALYLKAAIPVNELSSQDVTALDAATRARRVVIVKQLLAAKVDQSKWGPRQGPALSVATFAGDKELTSLLLNAGPPEEVIKRAYVSAGAAGQLPMLQDLAPRVSAAQPKLATDALWAVASGARESVAPASARAATAVFLLAAGADAQAVDPEVRQSTVLHRAADSGELEVARVLLDKGAAVDPRDTDGATPLWWMAGVGNVEMAELLIAHGADVKVVAKDGSSAMARARYNRDDQMIALLRQHGAR